MEWLFFAIIITSYVGLVVASMIKMNEAGVLEGRLLIVFLLPIVHFIFMPVGLLYKSVKEGIFFKVVSLIPTFFLLYPVTLAEYARLAKPLKKTQKVNVKKDIDQYEGVSEEMIALPC